MLAELKTELVELIEKRISVVYGVQHQPVAEVPPRRELGDLAFPAALHLARELRQKPRDIANSLVEELDMPSWVREIRVEGAGYLNVFLDRSAIAARMLTEGSADTSSRHDVKFIVEHTNINPNKAAHIGHLRNAVLGDVLVRTLTASGYSVEVQNYIDDTGVQLADVVVGFIDLRGMSLDEVAEIPDPFDYYCWDLYGEVGQWYEEEAERLEFRRETLRQLEEGEGERAEVGRLVCRRVVRRHLATMQRIDVAYDLLTHESAILELDFFAETFEMLKATGAVRLEAGGKNKGCWVMPLSTSEEFAGLEDPDKVIVRSDGTVTYVGKDIAYQLWKFGLLERDFKYRLWQEEEVWETTVDGTNDHPAFGSANRVVNVIDARQSYLQKVVRAGLEALGYEQQAKNSIHFAYEMVTLSAATAAQMGYLDGEDNEGSGGLEMSGRKGIGVKADDLIDQLVDKSRQEISTRDRELPLEKLDRLAHEIAIAALRFFMIKATTNRVIAFDLNDALSFEGDSGPYLQYSAVRARNIQRRLLSAGMVAQVDADTVAQLSADLWADDLWDLVLSVALIPQKIDMAGATLELSILARHALELAQKFHAVYHRHPIMQEENESLRHTRLAATMIFLTGLETMSQLLGIPLPDRM